MTTIVYRDGVLATDSLICNGDARFPGKFKKLYVLPQGGAAAISGDAGGAQDFLAWLLGGEEGATPKISDNTRVTRLLPSRVLRVYESVGAFELEVDYLAYGSGAPFALGALAVGASAEEAVRAAILHDCFSGGEIQKYEVL